MKLFLTSSPIGIYRSEEPLDYEGFNPANGMVEALKEYWPENARCMLISAFPDDYEINDRMREDFEGILKDTGLCRQRTLQRSVGKPTGLVKERSGRLEKRGIFISYD